MSTMVPAGSPIESARRPAAWSAEQFERQLLRAMCRREPAWLRLQVRLADLLNLARPAHDQDRSS